MSGKKHWETPKLTVIERSKPQEAVLQVCKYGSTKSGEFQQKTTISCKDTSGYTSCVNCLTNTIS